MGLRNGVAPARPMNGTAPNPPSQIGLAGTEVSALRAGVIPSSVIRKPPFRAAPTSEVKCGPGRSEWANRHLLANCARSRRSADR